MRALEVATRHAIVAELRRLRRRFARAQVSFARGEYWGAPAQPVWLVYPEGRGSRLGPGELIAICPRSARVLFAGEVGE